MNGYLDFAIKPVAPKILLNVKDDVINFRK